MFIATISPEEATGPVADAYTAAAEAWGFLPNWAQAFAQRPQVLAAWAQLNATIREGMDRRRYELATVAAARHLRSTYCTMAHTWMLRDQLGFFTSGELMEIVADPHTAAPLDHTDRVVMAFAKQVAHDASAISADDVDELRRHGLTDADVLDVALAAAARCFFAKLLDAVGAQADHELGELMGPELGALLTFGRPVEAQESEGHSSSVDLTRR